MHVGLNIVGPEGNFRWMLEEARLAEEVGFDSVWVSEHHGHPSVWPCPLVLLAGLASVTSRVRLGTFAVLLPLDHPLHVAERASVVDVMSDGRLILGVGQGFAEEDFAAFGLSRGERGGRFEEAVEVLTRLWTEETVTYKGRFYSLSEARLEPRPRQRPRPPLWMGAWVEKAVRRVARLGDRWMTSPTAPIAAVQANYRAYRDEARGRFGSDIPGIALARYVFVADTTVRAIEEGGQALGSLFRSVYRDNKIWRHKQSLIGDASVEDLVRDWFVVGSPEDCAAKIRAWTDAMEVDTFICRMWAPGMSREAMLRSIRMFGREVLPRLAR